MDELIGRVIRDGKMDVDGESMDGIFVEIPESILRNHPANLLYKDVLIIEKGGVMSSIKLDEFKELFHEEIKFYSKVYEPLNDDKTQFLSNLANIAFLRWFNKNIISNTYVTISPEPKNETELCPECSQPLTNGRCHKCDQAGQ